MRKAPVFSVGDRVVANTENWGRVTGIVVEVTLGRYLQIKSDHDQHVYGVSADNCQPLDHDHRRRFTSR